MPSTGATGTKWYCEAPPLAEPVLLPRSGLSINPHLKWGSLTLKWWDEEYKEPNHIADAGKMVGKWQQINKNEVNVIPEYRCSNCGAEFSGFGFDFDYCPRCGSVMEDEE